MGSRSRLGPHYGSKYSKKEVKIVAVSQAQRGTFLCLAHTKKSKKFSISLEVKRRSNFKNTLRDSIFSMHFCRAKRGYICRAKRGYVRRAKRGYVYRAKRGTI